MKHFYFVIPALTLALFSCKKNNDQEMDPRNNFDQFMSSRKAKNQQFTINGATGGTIVGEDGSKVRFPANAFVDGNGNPVTGGVIVTLNESLERKDWIMDKLSTEANGAFLESGGMIRLQAKRAADGAELKPAPAMVAPAANLDSAIRGEVPRNGRPDMQLFLQRPAQVGPGAAPQNTWGAAPYYPFGNGPNSYVFQIPQFQWVNCDRLYSDPRPKTTVTVTPNLNGINGAADLQVCLVYRDIQTVITLVPDNSGVFGSYANSIPIGSTADVIIIGKNGGNQILFRALTATVFTANMNINIAPQVSTAADVDTYLNSVPQ